ncbi:MAG: peptidoglycan bridge formation glycyltransferase FemA/FemB family protein [bacterium]
MFQEITDKQSWDERVKQGEWHQFAQSWDWGEFQKAAGEKVWRFAHKDAFAQVIEKGLPLGMKLWFVPRGPKNFEAAHLKELAAFAKKAGAVLVRFEPLEKPSIGKWVRSVSPAVTSRIDLGLAEEEILAGMHQKTRYNLRLAEKKGVEVAESRDVAVWLDLIHATAERDRFHLHQDEYYRKMLASPIVKLFVASLEERPLAAMIAVFFGDAVTYLHGASGNESREVMAPFLLHWRVTQEAKQSGYKYYDFWGVNPSDAKSPHYKKSWEGLTRFKKGFGGEEVALPGTFELPARFWLYQLYSLRQKIRL